MLIASWNLLDWLILLLVAVGIFFSIRYLRRPKKGSCSGCSGCNYCNCNKIPPNKKNSQAAKKLEKDDKDK